MIRVVKYKNEYKEVWDNFVKSSINPLFMFERDYMDYHSDRFIDFSLMFYDEDELIAVLPMNICNDNVASHGGLTYGGLILNRDVKQHTVNDCIIELINYLKQNNISKVIYKIIPHIYHLQPCESEIYALWFFGFKIFKIEPSIVLNLKEPLKMPKGRKAQISRAKRENVEIKECVDKKFYDEFIDLENDVLMTHHGTTAVHTANELYMLFSRFPENIHLFGAFLDNDMIAGAVVFEYQNVIHTQYLAANDKAREIGALDFCVSKIIDIYKEKKLWLDFGISTENNGKILNEGLISQKEGFGGRTNAYLTFEYEINNNNYE